MNVATVCHEDIAAQGGGGTPLYKPYSLCATPNDRAKFWTILIWKRGCRLPILVSLESGIVFEGTTGVYIMN